VLTSCLFTTVREAYLLSELNQEANIYATLPPRLLKNKLSHSFWWGIFRINA